MTAIVMKIDYTSLFVIFLTLQDFLLVFAQLNYKSLVWVYFATL